MLLSHRPVNIVYVIAFGRDKKGFLGLHAFVNPYLTPLTVQKKKATMSTSCRHHGEEKKEKKVVLKEKKLFGN